MGKAPVRTNETKVDIIKRAALILLAAMAIAIGVYITIREIRIATGPHIRFGKTITLIVESDMNVTYQYVEDVCKGKISDSRFPFDMCAVDTQKAVVKHMKENDLVVVNGKYEINQGTYFKNGRFVNYGLDRAFHPIDSGFVFKKKNSQEAGK